MADEIAKDSQFRDGKGRERYSSYLNSETDRLALAVKEYHIEKIMKLHYAHKTREAVSRETTSNSVLEDLRSNSSTAQHQRPVDDKHSILIYHSMALFMITYN